MERKNHHAVRISTRGYFLLASYATREEAVKRVLAENLRTAVAVYRDGTTGRRYSPHECREFRNTNDYATRPHTSPGCVRGEEHKMGTLTIGTKYDLSTLRWDGWTEGDGSGHEGYNAWDYFDREGRYAGPDSHGIEPIFEVID